MGEISAYSKSMITYEQSMILPMGSVPTAQIGDAAQQTMGDQFHVSFAKHRSLNVPLL